MPKISDLVRNTTLSSDDEFIIIDQPSGVNRRIASSDVAGSFGVADYDTRADAIAATIATGVDAIRTRGYTAAGDGGDALYKRVATPAPVEAWHFQSADGAYWELVYKGRVDVRQFGAALDGSTDDTTALQNTADFLATYSDDTGNGLVNKHKPIFYIPPCDGAVITSQIDIGINISVQMDGPILVSATASAANTWVRIGYVETGNYGDRTLEHVIDVRRVTLSDWSSENDIGCKLASVAASKVYLRRADKFCIGVQMTGPYNIVHLGEFRDNYLGLDVVRSAYNFTNQNIFIGGEFATVSGVNPGESRYGIRVTDAGIGGQNSFVFIGQSYELNSTVASPGEAVPVLLNNVSAAQFKSQRAEGVSETAMRLTGDCRWNVFELLINKENDVQIADAIDDQSTYKFGNRIIQNEDFTPDKGVLVFDSGMIADKITNANGSTLYTIPNMESPGNTNPPTFGIRNGIDAINYTTRSVDFGTTYFGIRVDARQAKVFTICCEADTSTTRAMGILAFGSDGTQLTANTDVTQNAATPTITANTGVYGGLYGISMTGTQQHRTITLSDNVDHFFIGFAQGDIRNWQLYALGVTAAPKWWSETSKYNGDRIAQATPVNGHYKEGQYIRNVDPSVGSMGWLCTQTGQSGTLSGITGSITTGTSTLTVNDASDLVVGFAITIAGVSGNKIIEAIEGTTITLDSNADATVSGAAVQHVAPVFTDSLKTTSNFEIASGSTVAGLPTPSVGMIARVTDASAPSIGSTVTGGGAAYALVNYNGSNWTVIGI